MPEIARLGREIGLMGGKAGAGAIPAALQAGVDPGAVQAVIVEDIGEEVEDGQRDGCVVAAVAGGGEAQRAARRDGARIGGGGVGFFGGLLGERGFGGCRCESGRFVCGRMRGGRMRGGRIARGWHEACSIGAGGEGLGAEGEIGRPRQALGRRATDGVKLGHKGEGCVTVQHGGGSLSFFKRTTQS